MHSGKDIFPAIFYFQTPFRIPRPPLIFATDNCRGTMQLCPWIMTWKWQKLSVTIMNMIVFKTNFNFNGGSAVCTILLLLSYWELTLYKLKYQSIGCSAGRSIRQPVSQPAGQPAMCNIEDFGYIIKTSQTFKVSNNEIHNKYWKWTQHPP